MNLSPNTNSDRFAVALEECRRFLLTVANAEMPDRLIPKGGASDLVQETLMKAFTARQSFQGESLADLRAWLRVILRNEMVTFSRRFHATPRAVNREVPLHPAQASSVPGPVEHLVRVERATRMSDAVARLPEDVRQVLVLRLELQLGFREIGERLGRTEEAARKVFSRALDQLREATREHV